MTNAQRAEEIYGRILPKIKDQKGKIIAIEESGDYFIGNTVVGAISKAERKHPDKHFFIKRIGFRAVYFIGTAL